MKKKRESQEVSKHYFRASPSTINEDKRTVEVVFSTGARGLRYGWSGDYYEELGMTKKEVRLKRLRNIGSVLFGHDSHSLESLIGTVEKVSLDESSGEGVARIRFDTDEASDKVFQKVKNGILRAVSVGYNVYKYKELEEKQDDLPVYRAVDWEPAEISFVSVPFDAAATVRQAGDDGHAEKTVCTIERQGEKGMSKKKSKTKAVKRDDVKTEEAVDEPEVAAADPVDEPEVAAADPVDEPEVVAADPVDGPEVAAADPVEAETEEARAGVLSILRSCEKASLGADFARKLSEDFCSKKINLAQAQERVIEAWGAIGKKVRGPMDIESGACEKMDVLTGGIRNAIMHRIDPVKNTLDDQGRVFRGMSLLEVGRRYLDAVGIKTDGMTRSQVAAKLLSPQTAMHVRTGFMGTDDFPYILANVANKTLLGAYERVPQTFKPWTKRATAQDFKTLSRVRLGEGPILTKVTEHGEFTYGTFGESREQYALATYGKIVPFTRQAIINDDLSAFDTVIAALGMNAADLESDIVWAIITANANMSDSNALFSSAHGNLGTAGAPSETTLTEMRKLGRLQTGIDSAKLNIVHKYILVPAAHEVATQKLVTLVQPTQTSEVNVFANMYQVIVEPRLDANSVTAWYGAGEPGRCDTIEYCHLEGAESPVVEQETEFDTSGIKIKIQHDFAAKAIDWRNLFKNAGA